MSHSESKSEIQVSCPGQAFPLFSSPHPHIQQWCRFSVPPFRQDRLNRLPLPPILMATSKVTSNTGVGVPKNEKQVVGFDPLQKIQQLEKNLLFVRENHALMLKALHEEIADLKLKNKELLFELVTGVPSLPKDTDSPSDRDSPEEQQGKIDELEKEVKKLRGALKDAMKTNLTLTTQLQEFKSEQYSRHSSKNKDTLKSSPESSLEEEPSSHSPRGSSPQIDDYTKTLLQIQRAAANKNAKTALQEERHYRNSEGRAESYSKSGHHRSHRRHHHHNHHHNPQQQQQQPRLPRLPLRSQQNYAHAQYEIQYRQASTSTLPALVPVVDHRLDKPRKPRGPRPPKIADQVTNG